MRLAATNRTTTPVNLMIIARWGGGGGVGRAGLGWGIVARLILGRPLRGIAVDPAVCGLVVVFAGSADGARPGGAHGGGHPPAGVAPTARAT